MSRDLHDVLEGCSARMSYLKCRWYHDGRLRLKCPATARFQPCGAYQIPATAPRTALCIEPNRGPGSHLAAVAHSQPPCAASPIALQQDNACSHRFCTATVLRALGVLIGGPRVAPSQPPTSSGACVTVLCEIRECFPFHACDRNWRLCCTPACARRSFHLNQLPDES